MDRAADLWLGLFNHVAVPDQATSAVTACLATLATRTHDQLTARTTPAQIESITTKAGRPRVNRGQVANALDRLQQAGWIQLVRWHHGEPDGRIGMHVAGTWALRVPDGVIAEGWME